MKSTIVNKKYHAIDLFSGCGGLSEGLSQAGFDVIAALEIDAQAAKCYEMNHQKTTLIRKDIRKVTSTDIIKFSAIESCICSQDAHRAKGSLLSDDLTKRNLPETPVIA